MQLPVKDHVGRPGKNCKNITSEDSFTRTTNENEISTTIRVTRDWRLGMKRVTQMRYTKIQENLTISEIRSISRGLQDVVGELANQMKDIRD